MIEDAAQGSALQLQGPPTGRYWSCRDAVLSRDQEHNFGGGRCGTAQWLPEHAKRAEIIREKGTNRKAFFRGEVDKYSWVDIGSSYLPSELIAAFLWAQMEEAEDITQRRLEMWDDLSWRALDSPSMSKGLLEAAGGIPKDCVHNAHMYYILLPSIAKAHRTDHPSQVKRYPRGVSLHAAA